MRVVFYSRPWSADLHLALEDHWNQSGRPLTARYITHHVQVAQELGRAGREPLLLPDEIKRLDIGDPSAWLEGFERRHGDDLLPLTRYLMAERFFATRPRAWQLDQLARFARFFEDLYAEFRPELLIGESPDTMPAWLSYDLAPAFGCTALGVIPSTLPRDRLLMLRNHREVPWARDLYDAFRRDGVGEEERRAALALQRVVTGSGTVVDGVTSPRYLPAVLKDAIKNARPGQLLQRLDPRPLLGHSAWQFRERAASNWFVQPDPILDRLALPFRGLRARLADRLYLKDEPPSKPYVFFPLHFQPEASTLVHGSYFQNQIEVVHNLARSLPVGWELVLKEHFYMLGRRKLGFYRALKHIPNVRMLPFTVPTNQLVMNAEVVAVIASTTGLEAALIGKPVVMFGDYPWDYAPTIAKVEALADLPELIRTAAAGALPIDDPDVLAFAASWDAALPRGRYMSAPGHDRLAPENLARITEALERVVAGTRPLDQSPRLRS